VTPGRLHVVVRGRVQGVGFRWFVREAARALDLAGHVLNRRDGGVEVEAEGSASALAALRRRLEEGPDGARVESLDELPSSAAALERPFTITR
jgi:acylphosphatase